MPRPFTFADREPPAEIREHEPLFDWAREQAAAAKELDAKIAAARKKHDATLAMLTESVEHGEVEAAKERLRDARKAAQRSSVYRDPAPERAVAFPDLTPVGRNADLWRIYVDASGAVLRGHYFDGCEVPFFATASETPERDLEEAREWARLRAEWDAAHPNANEHDADEED